MASTQASYRKPQPALTLEVRTEQIPSEQRTLHQIWRDLEALCAAGLIEAVRDEHGVVRYRPIQRAA